MAWGLWGEKQEVGTLFAWGEYEGWLQLREKATEWGLVRKPFGAHNHQLPTSCSASWVLGLGVSLHGGPYPSLFLSAALVRDRDWSESPWAGPLQLVCPSYVLWTKGSKESPELTTAHSPHMPRIDVTSSCGHPSLQWSVVLMQLIMLFLAFLTPRNLSCFSQALCTSPIPMQHPSSLTALMCLWCQSLLWTWFQYYPCLFIHPSKSKLEYPQPPPCSVEDCSNISIARSIWIQRRALFGVCFLLRKQPSWDRMWSCSTHRLFVDRAMVLPVLPCAIKSRTV